MVDVKGLLKYLKEVGEVSKSRINPKIFLVPQFSSVTQSCLTPCDPIDCITTGRPVHHQLPELAQTHAHWVDDAIQPSHPLSSLSPSFNLSQHQSLFQWVSSSHQVAKYWTFSFNISLSNEYSGLISFNKDWLDLLAVQVTLQSLLQHHSSRASILQHSAFFIIQLSHPYVTTGKTIPLTKQTFIGKVMLLLFNMLSRLVITFLPRSRCLLISWLQSPSVVILEPRKIKSDTVSTVSPSKSVYLDLVFSKMSLMLGTGLEHSICRVTGSSQKSKVFF